MPKHTQTLFFIDYFQPDNPNGICTYRHNLQDAFRHCSAWRIIMVLLKAKCSGICMDSKDGTETMLVPFDIGFRCKTANNMQFVKAMKAIASDNRCIVHFNWMNHAPLGIVIKKHMDARIVLTKHCVFWRESIVSNYPMYYHLQSYLETKEKSSFLAKRILREEMLFFNSADKTITVTEDAKRVVEFFYSVPSQSVACIHNGFHGTASACPKSEIRKRLGYGGQEKIMLYFGHVAEKKGLFHLMDIAHLLNRKLQDFRLIICGKGDFDAVLRHMAAPLRSHVDFTGHLGKEELSHYLAIADACVVPSLMEQCSYAALEAVHANVPLIMSDIPGLRELSYPHNKYMIRHKMLPSRIEADTASAAERAMELFNNAGLRDDHVRNMAEHVRKHFSVAAMVKATLQTYEDEMPACDSQQTDGPLVSVVMPCHNGAQYISEAIRSVLAQSYVNWELIVVDDGSTDDSLSIVKSMKDSRITLVRNKKNYGICHSLNKGIKRAKGKYIARLDADDMMLPGRLSAQIEFMEQHPDYAVVGGNHIVMDMDGMPLGMTAYPETDKEIRFFANIFNPFAHSSVMIRKAVLEEGYRYSNKYPYCEDYHLWMQIIRKHKLHNLQQTITLYRKNEKGLSVTNAKEQYENSLELSCSYMKRNGFVIKDDELKVLSAMRVAVPKDFWKTHDKELSAFIKRLSDGYGYDLDTQELYFMRYCVEHKYF